MFTGIVIGMGEIVAIRRGDQDFSIDVDTGSAIADPQIGESVSLEGVCLTVVSINGSTLTFDISAETIDRSTFKNAQVGDKLNMERAARMGDPLGGHLVSGHVDCVGTLTRVTPVGEGYEIEIELPADGMKYVIEKGSISISGISLTVAYKKEKSVTVAIIPHTWEVTTLGGLSTGEPVNIEYDMIGKYIESFVQALNPPGQRINKELTDKSGF